MIKSVDASISPYGSIQKIGMSRDGRAVYRVIDSEGSENSRLTVPLNEADKFEKAYQDIISVAPDIQNYTKAHSSPEERKQRKIYSFIAVASGGVLGAAISSVIFKSHSAVKNVLTAVLGIIAGISAGFATSVAITAPPGSYRFAKAARTFSKLDIKPLANEIKS